MADLVGGPDVAGILVRPDVVLGDAVLLTDVTVLVPQVTDLVLELIVVPALVAVMVATVVVPAVPLIVLTPVVAVLPAAPVVIAAVVVVAPAAVVLVVPVRGLVPAGGWGPAVRGFPALRGRPPDAVGPDRTEIVDSGHPQVSVVRRGGEVVPEVIPHIRR